MHGLRQEDLVHQYASGKDLLLEPVIEQLSKMKCEVHDDYTKLWVHACIAYRDWKVYAKDATNSMSFAQATKAAREWLRSKTFEEGLSHETMALVAYQATEGSPTCWELCLQDAGRVFTDRFSTHAQGISFKAFYGMLRFRVCLIVQTVCPAAPPGFMSFLRNHRPEV